MLRVGEIGVALSWMQQMGQWPGALKPSADDAVAMEVTPGRRSSG